MDIKTAISKDLDIPKELIDSALFVARKYVKIFRILKRNNKYRTIHQPSKKLKTLQYWLQYNIFEKLPVHEKAIAYRKTLSILHNAKLHRKNKYFLKIDLLNFFPSIKYCDLSPIVRKWHNEENPGWELDEIAEELIRETCFYIGDILPIGYPTSPMISNIVMHEFDKSIVKIIGDKAKFGLVTYTRYADDLIFSTNKKGACSKLLKVVSDCISKSKSPKIAINSEKTKFGSSSGGTASVTGLKIRGDGSISIHKGQKDHIRLLLSLYKKGKLRSEDHNRLLGHLSYIHHVDPRFYSKVQNKYYSEIARLKNASMSGGKATR